MGWWGDIKNAVDDTVSSIGNFGRNAVSGDNLFQKATSLQTASLSLSVLPNAIIASKIPDSSQFLKNLSPYTLGISGDIDSFNKTSLKTISKEDATFGEKLSFNKTYAKDAAIVTAGVLTGGAAGGGYAGFAAGVGAAGATKSVLDKPNFKNTLSAIAQSQGYGSEFNTASNFVESLNKNESYATESHPFAAPGNGLNPINAIYESTGIPKGILITIGIFGTYFLYRKFKK